jgi:hypothetical protein
MKFRFTPLMMIGVALLTFLRIGRRRDVQLPPELHHEQPQALPMPYTDGGYSGS